MENIISLVKKIEATRKMLEKILSSFSVDQLNQIPNGYSNNLIWNQAHLTSTFDLIIYGLSGLELAFSPDFYAQFKKGTTPNNWIDKSNIEKINNDTFLQLSTFVKDWENQKFKKFSPYTTSLGITLENVENALSFLLIHEGLHLGYSMALRKNITI